MALIDPALMASLVGIDESVMPSTCVVHFRTNVETSRGGTKPGAWQDRNATAMPCRVAPGGTAMQARPVAEQVQTIGDVTVQIALTAIKAQNVVVHGDDEITVTTTVSLPGNDLATVERYKVVGIPSIGSYATNLSVPCVKVS